MTEHKRYLIWSLGLLLLALIFAGCQQTADDPITPAATVTASPTATVEMSPTGLPTAAETATSTPTAAAAAPTPAAIAPADEAMIMGDPDAPVTIVEFSDYQCPFCSRYFQETWPKLKAEFVDIGRVRYVFKDFPLAELHPQAPKAHQAARCAGEQDAYWEMHDRLFAKQSEWGGRSKPAAVFKDFAAALELEASAFETCLDGGQWADAVDADLAEGASLGVRGTPTFFVDGYPLVGAQPYETFQMAIELAEQGRLGEAYRQRP